MIVFPARSFHSQSGRFMVPDPGGLASVNPTNPQTWNRYAYVADNPVSLVDPMGLQQSACGPHTNCGPAKAPGSSSSPSFSYGPAGNGSVWAAGLSGTFMPVYGWLGDSRWMIGYLAFAGQGQTGDGSGSVNCHELAAGQTNSSSLSSWLSGTATAAEMTVDWAAGTGDTSTDFGPDSPQSQEMMGAYGLAGNVSAFLAGGQSSGHQDFGVGGLFSTGLDPTGQFVGSYDWSMWQGGGYLNITLTNSTTAWSAFYHPNFLNPNPPIRPSTGWHPMGRVNQIFHLRVPC
jgi:RHS repeat-associated protein